MDESKSRGYLMAAAFVHPRHLQSPRKLAQRCLAVEAGIVVLDLDESVVSKDRRWLYEELHKSEIRYDHMHRLLWPAEDPTRGFPQAHLLARKPTA